MFFCFPLCLLAWFHSIHIDAWNVVLRIVYLFYFLFISLGFSLPVEGLVYTARQSLHTLDIRLGCLDDANGKSAT